MTANLNYDTTKERDVESRPFTASIPNLLIAREAYTLRSKSSSHPPVHCLIFEALSDWHFDETARCHATMAEPISLAKELNDMHALAQALFWAVILGHLEGNPAEVARLASDLIELSTRQNFAFWLPGGKILRGWARSTVTKKRAAREDVDSDYLFANCLSVGPFAQVLNSPEYLMMPH